MSAASAPARPCARASLAAPLRALGVRPGGAAPTVDDVRCDGGRFGVHVKDAGTVRFGPAGDGTGRSTRQRAAVDLAVDRPTGKRRTEER
ncbi:hypothetical protein [Micromonospora globbae]|uniref:Uncharacterized protein n=1 Tax=Micromonospora globbae TaxID=1894969 RepID=A0A420EUW7_9ACTN|nr:hypothetical protein [Micromonospora globbae]RKF24515.1 hypothetical protein D7I43_25425 [Micromonospora globbae]